MKRKASFTNLEAQAIKKLIALKVLAPPDQQKRIRDKIRKIGFYYSAFSSSKKGYTVADFEALIRSGEINIVD